MASGVLLDVQTSVSGAAGVIKVGAGTLQYSTGTANTFTLQTTVDEGTLNLAKTAAVNAYNSGVGANTNTAGLLIGDFNGTATVRVTTPFSQMPTQPVIVNGPAATLDITANAAPSAAINQTIGTLELRGATINTTPNTPTLANDTLTVGATVTGLPDSTTGTTVVGSTIMGSLILTSNPTNFNVADATTAAGTTFGLAIPAIISGPDGLSKAGSGTLTLS